MRRLPDMFVARLLVGLLVFHLRRLAPMLLHLHGITKRFGASRALHDVELSLEAGEIHALLGDSGAGKSTLLKVLGGGCRADAGSISLNGVRFEPRSPVQARRRGVSLLPQEPSLVPHLSVAENLSLGSEASCMGWIGARQRSRVASLAHKAFEALGIAEIDLSTPAGSLPLAQQRLVEIARSLQNEPKLLLLDEPTGSLTRTDAMRVLGAIRRLAASGMGVGVLYVSRFFEETSELCQRYTVLREGATVATGPMAGLDRPSALRLMLGNASGAVYPRLSHSIGKPVLELRAESDRPIDSKADLVVREGEIIGLAGLGGSGVTEILRALFGLEKLAKGAALLRGKRAAFASPAWCRRRGIGFLSREPEGDEILPNQTIADNITMPLLREFAPLGFISESRQYMAALDWMEKLGIRARSPFCEASQLSVPNRQKLAIARWLRQNARILLMDEPTLRMDLASKMQIYRLMGELASEGRSILFASENPAELLGVCDTVGAVVGGGLVAVRPAAEWTEEELVAVLTSGCGETVPETSAPVRQTLPCPALPLASSVIASSH